MSDDNPPAFPVHPKIEFEQDNEVYSGMWLRDWFAGQALPQSMESGIYDREGYVLPTHMRPASIAKHAYKIAAAMLAERKANP